MNKTKLGGHGHLASQFNTRPIIYKAYEMVDQLLACDPLAWRNAYNQMMLCNSREHYAQFSNSEFASLLRGIDEAKRNQHFSNPAWLEFVSPFLDQNQARNLAFTIRKLQEEPKEKFKLEMELTEDQISFLKEILKREAASDTLFVQQIRDVLNVAELKAVEKKRQPPSSDFKP